MTKVSAFTEDTSPTSDDLVGTVNDPSGTPNNRKVTLANAVGVLSWKQTVRVATTANGTLATAYENGDTIDGIVLATGDRILLKNQTTGSENGIYTVNASGAPTRATDFNTGAKALGGVTLVQEGTINTGRVYRLTNTGTITIDTTALTFKSLGSDIGCKADRTTVFSINNVTWTNIDLNTESYDTDAMHDNVTNNTRVTINTAGKYLIIIYISFADSTGGTTRGEGLQVNGATQFEFFLAKDPSGRWRLTQTFERDCIVGDYFEVKAYQDSGGALDVNGVYLIVRRMNASG